MNIFQFLGLSPTHRKESKVTQLVKHYDEVPESRKKGKNFGLQLKKDGVCAITIVRDGLSAIFSRTGRKFTNTSFIVRDIDGMNLRDGVYFGELTCDLHDISLEVLSGIVNPNRVKELTNMQNRVISNLTMNFFDMISIESFIEGASQTPFRVRHSNLEDRIYSFTTDPNPNNSVKVIPYGTSTSEAEIDEVLDLAVKVGEEGLVIIDLEADWEAGHKGWRKMKKVRGCDYDLLCIGYEEGTGKYLGKVANLIFKWKGGKTIKCMLGKGWTHQMAEDMFKVIKHLENNELPSASSLRNDNPIGKIFQVYALEESSKGKLRLPKVGEQRHDKSESDV